MSKLEFHFDFGSPNAYFVHRMLPELEARVGQTFTYVPILLGGVFKLTNNQPPFAQFGEVKNKMEYFRLEIRRFIAKQQMTKFTMNPAFPVNTVKIMRGAIVAERAGWGADYIEAVFHHMWEDPKPMGEADIMRQALTASGLDADAIMTGIEDQSVKDELVQNTNATVERGNFGAPTFFVGDEMFFGKDRMQDVEEEILAQNQA